MLKARDIMTKDLITLSPETEISEAAGILLERRINGAPVVDANGRLIGILCQSDLIAQQKRIPVPSVFALLDSFIPLSSQKTLEREIKKIAATKVADAMTENPVSVNLETPLEEIATLMVERKFHTLPVVDGGKVVGVIGKEDVLRTILPIPADS